MAVNGIGGPPARTRRGSNELIFTTFSGSKLKLSIFRDKTHRVSIKRRAAPAEEGQRARYRESAKVWRDWIRGAGFAVADDTTEGGYDYGSYVTSWCRGLLGPSGYVEEITLPAGTVTRFNKSFVLAGHLWYTCLNERMLKVQDMVGPAYDATVTMTAGAQSQDCEIFRDRAWIANGGAARIWSFDGTTWSPATDDVRRSRMAKTNWVLGSQMAGAGMTAGSSYRILITSHTSLSSVYHCSGDPGVAANHVGPNTVGDSVYPIQGLNGTSEAAFARKPDGIYMIQGGGRMPNLSPWWADQYDASNGGYGEFYDGMFFGGTTQGLDMISPDTQNLGLQQWCQPGANESHESSPIFGRPVASARIDGWFFQAFYNGARSYVMRGKRAERMQMRNRNPMIWHGYEFACDGVIRDMRVVIPTDSSLPRYIFYATDDNSGVPHLYRQDFPREPTPYAAYRRGSSWRAYPAWNVVMSAEDLGDPDAPKVARFYGAVAEGLGDGNSVTLSTSTDVTASAQQAQLTASPRDYAVADETSARGHRVTVTASVINDPLRSVWIRAAKMRGTVNDEKTTVITVPIELSRHARNPNGTAGALRDSRADAVRLYGLLEEGPVQLNDWMGRDVVAVLEDLEEEEVEDEDRNGVTRIATLTISVMLSKSRYGSAIYSSGRFG